MIDGGSAFDELTNTTLRCTMVYPAACVKFARMLKKRIFLDEFGTIGTIRFGTAESGPTKVA